MVIQEIFSTKSMTLNFKFQFKYMKHRIKTEVEIKKNHPLYFIPFQFTADQKSD